MFTDEELEEINVLCEKNELFAKYMGKYQEESDNLLAYVTHEIGNGLTLINSTAQLMESQNQKLCEMKYWGAVKKRYRGCERIIFKPISV